MSAFGQAGFGSMNRRRQLQAQGQLDPYGQQVRAAKQAPTMTAYAQPNAQATGQAPQQSAAAIKQPRAASPPSSAPAFPSQPAGPTLEEQNPVSAKNRRRATGHPIDDAEREEFARDSMTALFNRGSFETGGELVAKGGNKSMVFPMDQWGRYINPQTGQLISKNEAERLAMRHGSVGIPSFEQLNTAKEFGAAWEEEKRRVHAAFSGASYHGMLDPWRTNAASQDFLQGVSVVDGRPVFSGSRQVRTDQGMKNAEYRPDGTLAYSDITALPAPGTAQPIQPQSQGTPYSGMRVDAYSLGQNQGGAPNGFQTAGQNSGGQPAIQDPVRYFKERGSNPWNLADPSTQRARENPAEYQAALAAISQLQDSFDPRTMEMTRVKDPRKFVELQRRQLGVDALPQTADLRKQYEEAQRAALMEQSDAFRSGRQATEMETELGRRMQNFDDRQRSYGTGHYDPKTYGTNSAYAYASGIRQEQDDLRKLIADTSRRRTARESTEKMLQEDPRRYFEDRARSLGTDWRDEVVQMAALSNSEAMMDQPLVQQAVRTLNQQLQSEAGYQGPYQDQYFIYNKSPWRK